MPIVPPPPNSVSAVGTTSGPTQASGTYAIIPEMTNTIVTHGGNVYVDFVGSFANQNVTFFIAIFLDGTQVTASTEEFAFTGGGGLLSGQANIVSWTCSVNALLTGLAPGSHIITAEWRTTTGTAAAVTTQRQLISMEIL